MILHISRMRRNVNRGIKLPPLVPVHPPTGYIREGGGGQHLSHPAMACQYNIAGGHFYIVGNS